MFDSVLTSAITLLTIKKWFGNYKDKLQLSMINIIHRDVCTCVHGCSTGCGTLSSSILWIYSRIHQEEYVFVANIFA